MKNYKVKIDDICNSNLFRTYKRLIRKLSNKDINLILKILTNEK